MKILITGGTGFIGKHLQKELLAGGIDFELFKGKLEDIESVSESYDFVIHMAAKLKTDAGVFSIYDTNVIGTQRVIDFCIENQSNLIFLSTSGVYGEDESGIQKDEDFHCSPVNPYPISKLLAEKLCERAFFQSGLSCVVLRLFNVYGSMQRENFLIPDIIESLKRSSPLVLKTPYAVRDFINVKDVVSSIISSMSLKGFHRLNIGSGETVSLLDLIKKMEILTNREIKLDLSNALHQKSVGVIAEISKAKEILNWKPEVDLMEGLKEILVFEEVLS